MTKFFNGKYGFDACRPAITALVFLCAVLSGPAAMPGWAAPGKADYPILQPVNTSSPHATLRSFLLNAERAQKEFRKSGYRSKAAQKHVQRAASTLDLTQVPKSMRDDVGFESVLRLKVIFDHIAMPALDAVPRAADLRPEAARFWRIPQTDITIARVREGPREGAWLFTAETVARIRVYYKLLEEFRAADDTTANLFEEYIYAPGWMIPAGLLNALPKWMRAGVFEQAIWQWVGLILALGIGIGLLVWLRRAAKWLQRNRASDDRRGHWEHLLFPVLALLVLWALFYFIDDQVHITGQVWIVVAAGIKTAIFVFYAWIVFVGGDLVNETIAHTRRIQSTSIAADVTRMGGRLLSYVIIFILFFNLAEELGIPVGAVFASAGIAGFAVAMAAKDSLSNLFGGLTIFMDRPFRPGDYIVLDNNERGEVMHIGMRSTRIKTRDDVMITIPNAAITNAKIVNQSSPEPAFRIRVKVGVAYGSNIKQVEVILVQQVLSNPLAARNPEPRVRFRAFGDSSLEFELLCWARRPQDRGRLVHELNTGIYEAFNAAGIEIPFPQQDVYVRRRPEAQSKPDGEDTGPKAD